MTEALLNYSIAKMKEYGIVVRRLENPALRAAGSQLDSLSVPGESFWM
jgi:hypothetical protein